MPLLACDFQHTDLAMPCTHRNPALVPVSHWRRSSSCARLQTPCPAPAFVVCHLLDGNSKEKGLHSTIYCLVSPGPRSDCLIKKPPSYSGEGMLRYQGEQAWRSSITLCLRLWHQDILWLPLQLCVLGPSLGLCFLTCKGEKMGLCLGPTERI